MSLLGIAVGKDPRRGRSAAAAFKLDGEGGRRTGDAAGG